MSMKHFIIGGVVGLIIGAWFSQADILAKTTCMFFTVQAGLISASIGHLLEKKFPKYRNWFLFLTFVLAIIGSALPFAALFLAEYFQVF